MKLEVIFIAVTFILVFGILILKPLGIDLEGSLRNIFMILISGLFSIWVLSYAFNYFHDC